MVQMYVNNNVEMAILLLVKTEKMVIQCIFMDETATESLKMAGIERIIKHLLTLYKSIFEEMDLGLLVKYMMM